MTVKPVVIKVTPTFKKRVEKLRDVFLNWTLGHSATCHLAYAFYLKEIYCSK